MDSKKPSLPPGEVFHVFFYRLLNFFLKSTLFEKKSFRNTIPSDYQAVWDPDQARRFVGFDLGPNCLQRLSADDTRRQRVKR